jgi:competence protein ComEA
VPDVAKSGPRSAPRAAAGALCIGLALIGLGSRATQAPEGVRAPVVQREAEPPGAAALRRGEPLDLNRASAAELELLPAIGPALAARIVADRLKFGPFRAVDELTRVRGVGPRTVARLASLLRVESPRAR